jgi:hypothetical protein
MKFPWRIRFSSHTGQAAVLRFGLLVVAFGDSAFFEAYLLKTRRFTQTARSVLQFEPPVERRAGCRRWQRSRPASAPPCPYPVRPAGSPARIRSRAGAAPDVQFSCRKIHSVVVEDCFPAGIATAAFRSPLTFRQSVSVHLRKLRGAHDAVSRCGPFDIGRRNLQIQLVSARFVPESTERGPRTGPTTRYW